MATTESAKSSPKTNGGKSDKLEVAQRYLAEWQDVRAELKGLQERQREAAKRLFEFTGKGKQVLGPDGKYYRAEKKVFYEIDPATKKHKLDAQGNKIPTGEVQYQIRELGEIFG